MSDQLRKLNSAGVLAFAAFLESARDGSSAAPPFHLLTDPAYSEEMEGGVAIDNQPPSAAFVLGTYLKTVLAKLDRREIVYDHGLWSWLSLYYFDAICPVRSGARRVLEDAVYVLAETFNHQRYYRHLLRTAWLAVTDNGEYAKVLLTTKGKRSELFEQLASRQAVFGNPTVIAAAYKLYFDPIAGAPKRGAGGKVAGSARRLVSFIQQIDLTYDLRDCPPEQFLALLPAEFDKFKDQSAAALAKKTRIRNLLSRVIPRAAATATAQAAN